jgi:hypothetical protein
MRRQSPGGAALFQLAISAIFAHGSGFQFWQFWPMALVFNFGDFGNSGDFGNWFYGYNNQS